MVAEGRKAAREGPGRAGRGRSGRTFCRYRSHTSSMSALSKVQDLHARPEHANTCSQLPVPTEVAGAACTDAQISRSDQKIPLGESSSDVCERGPVSQACATERSPVTGNSCSAAPPSSIILLKRLCPDLGIRLTSALQKGAWSPQGPAGLPMSGPCLLCLDDGAGQWELDRVRDHTECPGP